MYAVKYTWGKILKFTSVHLHALQTQNLSPLCDFQYEDALLLHTSLEQKHYNFDYSLTGNVITGMYSMFPSYLRFLFKCEMCSNVITMCRHCITEQLPSLSAPPVHLNI